MNENQESYNCVELNLDGADEHSEDIESTSQIDIVELDDSDTGATPWTAKRSTKKPLKRKRSQEEDDRASMLNYVMGVLRSKESKPRDADELFGQSIGESLKSILHTRN